jgi:hypothetical protein
MFDRPFSPPVYTFRLRETVRETRFWRHSTLTPRLNSRGEAVEYASHQAHFRLLGLAWVRVPWWAYSHLS